MIRLTPSQAGRLLGLISEINGRPAIDGPLPLDEEVAILLEIDGGPKIYLTRRRTHIEATSHGYAANGRDALACAHLLRVVAASPRVPCAIDDATWCYWIQDVRDLARIGRLDTSRGRMIAWVEASARALVHPSVGHRHAAI